MRFSFYDRCLYAVVLAGGLSAGTFKLHDVYAHQTITARFEEATKRCRDEMRHQARVQLCEGTIVTDKKMIRVDREQGSNALKGLEKGHLYQFRVQGLGRTARPVLADGPDNIRLVHR